MVLAVEKNMSGGSSRTTLSDSLVGMSSPGHHQCVEVPRKRSQSAKPVDSQHGIQALHNMVMSLAMETRRLGGVVTGK